MRRHPITGKIRRYSQSERMLDRFHECVNKVWDEIHPDIWAELVISYGRRAGIF